MSRLKLLLIEDDDKIAGALRRGLSAEGFTVEVADRGDTGLWLAREGHFDLIILDLLLPGLNGFVVCSELRAAGDWTPVLMLTAKDGDLDEAEGLDTGADDYLTKPFSFPVLVARVHALLRRSARRDLSPVAAGNLFVKVAERRVYRGDVEVELTAREFDVLHYLVRRQGEVVSKAEILDAVWDFGFEGDPNIVEVYVGRLRKKIDAPFGTRSIGTVRGAGYRLAGDGG